RARGACAETAHRAPGRRTEGTRAVELRIEAVLGCPQRVFGSGLPLSLDRHELPKGRRRPSAVGLPCMPHLGPRPATPVMPVFVALGRQAFAPGNWTKCLDQTCRPIQPEAP